MIPGPGLLQCSVYDHVNAGMSAIYQVKDNNKLTAASNGATRMYYIAMERVLWDYAPLGLDGCTGKPFNEDQQVCCVNGRTSLFQHRCCGDCTIT